MVLGLGARLADVMVSYCREVAALVEKLVHAIEAHGVTVWWDRALEHGSEFGAEIEGQIQSASSVVVCWTPAAAKSRWVRGEADRAEALGKYSGVLLENCSLPIPFNTLNNANLRQWQGDADDLQFLQVLENVGRSLGRSDLADRASTRRRELERTESRLKAEAQAHQLREQQAAEEAARLAELERTKGLRAQLRLWHWLFLPLIVTFITAVCGAWMTAHDKTRHAYIVALVDGRERVVTVDRVVDGRPWSQLLAGSSDGYLTPAAGARPYTVTFEAALMQSALDQLVYFPANFLLCVLFAAVTWLLIKGFRPDEFIARYQRALLWNGIASAGLNALFLISAWFSFRALQAEYPMPPL